MSVAVARSASGVYVVWPVSIPSASASARFESFDERLGGKCSAAGRAGFDPRGLVHFVAEGGDFAATGGEDAPDVQRRTPVEPEPQVTARMRGSRCALRSR